MDPLSAATDHLAAQEAEESVTSRKKGSRAKLGANTLRLTSPNLRALPKSPCFSIKRLKQGTSPSTPPPSPPPQSSPPAAMSQEEKARVLRASFDESVQRKKDKEIAAEKQDAGAHDRQSERSLWLKIVLLTGWF